MNVRFTPVALAIAVLASGCASQQGAYPPGGPSLPPPAMSIPSTPAGNAPADSSQQAGYLKMPQLESLVSPIALHARRLCLAHPVRYDRIELEAPLPPEWDDYGFSVPVQASG